MLTSMPSPGVIEMTLVVTAGPRARALAVRLERAATPAAARVAGKARHAMALHRHRGRLARRVRLAVTPGS